MRVSCSRGAAYLNQNNETSRFKKSVQGAFKMLRLEPEVMENIVETGITASNFRASIPVSEAIAKIEEPIPSLFRIPRGVEVIAIQQISYSGLHTEFGANGHGCSKIYGRQAFPMRLVES